MEKRKWFAKSDLILTAVIVFLSLVAYAAYGFFTKDYRAEAAEIFIDGEYYKTVSLSENRIFTVPERENIVFEIKDGAIRFKESDCPDKVCVHTGYINKPSQTAVCLPNGISLKITSKKNDVDTVVG